MIFVFFAKTSKKDFINLPKSTPPPKKDYIAVAPHLHQNSFMIKDSQMSENQICAVRYTYSFLRMMVKPSRRGRISFSKRGSAAT